LKTQRAALEVLFPEVRAKLLRLLFTAPPKQHYVRELMQMSGLALHTVQDELRKLGTLGILVSWSNGYHRFHRANPDHPFYSHLLGIIRLSKKLPHAKHSALYRRQPRRVAKRKRRSKGRALPPDRAITWNLFSQRRKT
jgi:hypothetical protein